MEENLSAIIDLGTNTFHLLVATDRKEIFYEEKRPVRMGVGGINKGIITPDGIARTVDCIIQFHEKCKELNVYPIRAFGTSALRNAKNRLFVLQKIQAATGIEVQIISGDEEARLIYLGVRQAVNLGSDKNLIMDIGGGSVEFIIANEKEIFWKQSFEVGGQRLLERFQKHDPILSEELESLNLYLDNALGSLIEQIKIHKPKTLIGSSGTFETLSDIHCVMHDLSNPQAPESPLTIDSVQKIYQQLIIKNKEQRIAMRGMMEWRSEMIVVTTSIVKFLLEAHAFQGIKVSRYSLKEGVLFKN